MNLSISDELQLFSQELRRYLSPSVLQQLAKDVGFVQRSSKFRAQELVALCVWLSQRIGSTSLTQLCSQLETSTDVSISPEGLNQRFNQSAVCFLRQLFTSLLSRKLYASHNLSHRYASRFKQIRILDSTTFQLPDIFTSIYQGTGGSGGKAGMKIQLEYDLLSGQFLHVHSGPGKDNDKPYGSTYAQTVQEKDLCIRDLGYFKLNDLREIHTKGAYYLSRLKVNARIYQRNPYPAYFKDGRMIKRTEYIQVDMEEIMNRLQPGQTIELPESYIGKKQSLPARVIIHRLTEKQAQERKRLQAMKEKQLGFVYRERSKRLSAINVYITNTPSNDVPSGHVHSLYSLRWQIELLFKRGSLSLAFIVVSPSNRKD